MANPLIHSKSSVKRWGGIVEDYLPIHELLDSPKATMNNNSSRMLTHQTWFIYTIIPKVFGYNIVNSDGKSVDTVDIAMQHVLEDFRHKFIPTAQDYLQHLNLPDWIHNGIKNIDNESSKQLAIDFIKEMNTKYNIEDNEL